MNDQHPQNLWNLCTSKKQLHVMHSIIKILQEISCTLLLSQNT